MVQSDSAVFAAFAAVWFAVAVSIYVTDLRQDAGGSDLFLFLVPSDVRCMHGAMTLSDVYRRVVQLPNSSLAPGTIVAAETARGGFVMRHVAAVNQTHVELTAPMHGKAGCENLTIDRATVPLWEAKLMCRGFYCNLWCYFLTAMTAVV
jgi:hypothetical protein